MASSITGHARINLHRPGVDAAGQVGHVGETVVQQELGLAPRADAVVTADDRRPRRVEFTETLGELAHRQVNGAVDAGSRKAAAPAPAQAPVAG